MNVIRATSFEVGIDEEPLSEEVGFVFCLTSVRANFQESLTADTYDGQKAVFIFRFVRSGIECGFGRDAKERVRIDIIAVTTI